MPFLTTAKCFINYSRQTCFRQNLFDYILDGIPQKHGVRDYGSAEIDFLKFEDTGSKITGLPRKVIAHGKTSLSHLLVALFCNHYFRFDMFIFLEMCISEAVRFYF